MTLQLGSEQASARQKTTAAVAWKGAARGRGYF